MARARCKFGEPPRSLELRGEPIVEPIGEPPLEGVGPLTPLASSLFASPKKDAAIRSRRSCAAASVSSAAATPFVSTASPSVRAILSSGAQAPSMAPAVADLRRWACACSRRWDSSSESTTTLAKIERRTAQQKQTIATSPSIASCASMVPFGSRAWFVACSMAAQAWVQSPVLLVSASQMGLHSPPSSAKASENRIGIWMRYKPRSTTIERASMSVYLPPKVSQ